MAKILENNFLDSELERLPKCTDCGEPIVSDTFYEIGIERLCESCLNNHRRWTDEYTE